LLWMSAMLLALLCTVMIWAAWHMDTELVARTIHQCADAGIFSS
jgi:hypothetical protein